MTTVTIEQAACICHELNRAYCNALADFSQVAWDGAPGWQRESAIKGVKMHMSGDHGPCASHDAWFAEKIADGWKYGDVKDAAMKTHPCMVPFDDLPQDQQIKDTLFAQTVRALRPLIV